MFSFYALVIVLITQFILHLVLPVPGPGAQMQPSGLKKSMAAIPSSPQACGSDWASPDDTVGRQNFASTDHAPLSPQSSVASSGSEQTEDQGSARNTFQEDGSGMKGRTPLRLFDSAPLCAMLSECNASPPWLFAVDVPAWLKSLRLHKYASLFSQMTYEEMMILTEQHLESQVYRTILLIYHCYAFIPPSPLLSLVIIISLNPDDTSTLNGA